uniref:Uncharacterized protein n=1 Tax=Nelumbo nucifera TaxID=4432 RepID=A0A822XJ28_NELNU|nr:TPA_asm: hypothetical protein HUJ06_021720 [Nelumbo nucifera]
MACISSGTMFIVSSWRGRGGGPRNRMTSQGSGTMFKRRGPLEPILCNVNLAFREKKEKKKKKSSISSSWSQKEELKMKLLAALLTYYVEPHAYHI